MHVIDAVTGAIVDPYLHQTSTEAPAVSKVSLLHSTNAGNDTRNCVGIPQTAEPTREIRSLANFYHKSNVAYGLQKRKEVGS